ncbi:TlpA disulfide reductase family protein [Pseudoruegeria sp. HB172150]|uniref:TlpA family protein disulfide reductase n=1 Tax=Pseudoruegeria sp. HB172150 TaxID=2721164 RepID=UPI001556FB6E|nr:TlpA disulfide reductase family protein [Pseudoruegeria sp. HB172150]
MRWFRFAVLYTCLGLTANAAGAADISALEEMREGDMRKLVFAEAEALPEVGFVDEADSPVDFGQFEGKYLLVNFWATWCAPCRLEMPSLAALQEKFGGDDFQVVTIATGRNPVPAMKRFFEEVGVENLPLYRDPKQQLARQMAVLALPISIVVDPEGNEIARLRGDADWASEEAFKLFEAMLEGAGR